jgi:uncharacterized protein
MAKFYIYRDAKGEYRWRLRVGNGRIIADSGEGYVRKIDCERSIELVKEGSGRGGSQQTCLSRSQGQTAPRALGPDSKWKRITEKKES